MTAWSLSGIIYDMGLDAANVMNAVDIHWGITLDPEDAQTIVDLEPAMGLDYALGQVVCDNYTLFGWTTHGHSGEDVPLWVYEPNKWWVSICGLYDNTDLAKIAAEKFRFSLDSVDEELFVDVADAGFDSYSLTSTDPEYDNPVLVVQHDGKTWQLPVSKDMLIDHKDRVYNLDGIVVYAPVTNKIYIPEEAVRKIK
jgi:alkaline phosphatase